MDMKKIFAKSLILFFLLFTSCLKDNIPLSNVREDYTGDELRIDGFYYQKTPEGNINNTLYFFYRNGIKFELQMKEKVKYPIDCISELTSERIESQRKRKYHWGIFKINDNAFLSEQWSTPIDGNYVHTITQTGEIVSDTTFIITKFINTAGGGAANVNASWYFSPYSPKPDSTNVFIK
jgi:hypothetical protein